MATSLAVLGIKLDPTKAIAGAKKAVKAIRSIGGAAKKAAGAVGNVGKSLAKFGGISLGVVATIGYLVKRSLNATDAMTKMSRAIGLSVEDLQKMRHAGSLAGLEATALDKAVQKLAINIADVARGTGEAKDIFEKYGVAAKDVDGDLRSVTDVMAEFADITANVTNKTEQAELAYRLFGARGGKMINMLQQGSVAMREQWEEAEALGLVMSEKTAKGVEAANDAITRLTSYISASFTRAIAELAPAIKILTDNIRAWIEMKIDEEGGIGKVATVMANAVIQAGISILNSFEMIGNGMIRFVQNLNTITPAWAGGIRTIEEITNDLVDAQQRLASATDDQTELMKLAAKQIKEYGAELAIAETLGMEMSQLDFSDLRTTLTGLLIPMGAVADTAEKANEKTKTARELLLERTKAERALLHTIRMLNPEYATQAATLEKTAPLLEAIAAFGEKYGLSLEQIRDLQAEVFDSLPDRLELETLKDDIEGIFGANGSLASGMGRAVADVVVYGKNAKEMFQNLGKTILHTVISSLVKMGVQMAINWAMSKLFNKTAAVEATATGATIATAYAPAASLVSLATAGANAIPASAGMMATAAVGQAIASFEGGGFTGSGSRSGGVDGKGGFPAILHPNETVVDHTKGQDGGKTANVTFQIIANDTAGFDDLLQSRRGHIIGMINQALNDQGRPALA